MNSSGIKRGLAVSAVSALAVAGVPALASSASAAVGDSFTVVSTGPALNGGGEGALVVLRAKDGQITPADVDVIGASSSVDGSEDTGDQNVSVIGVPTIVQDSADAAYEFIHVRVGVTTTNAGDSASFRIFEDDTDNDALDASEARQAVTVATAGPVAKIVLSPTTLSTPQGIESGAFTVSLQDDKGRATQLEAGDALAIADDTVEVTETGPDTIGAADDAITSDEIVRGTATFTANPAGAAVGNYNIVLTDGNTPTVKATATLQVTKSATLTEPMVDIVTGADSWNGFNGGTFGGTTNVRVDQGTIKIDIKGGASNANSNVALTLNGANGTTPVTFGGKNTTTVSTVLDASGNGSLTITPDAGTVQVGDTIEVSGAFSETLAFSRASVFDIVPTADTYFSKVGGSTDVTVKVVDQFGLPITTGFVTAARDGVNAAADATPQKKAVGADGTVTFSFADTKAANGGAENVDVKYYADQFSSSADYNEGNVAVIKYTTDGMGANFVTSLDGTNTEAADYNASKVTIAPLADTVESDQGGGEPNEAATIALSTPAEPGASMKLSVDNGALILAPGQTLLSEGKDSVTVTLDGGGNLPVGYRVIGTKSGVVTVTLNAANRTETAALTVGAQVDPSTARNVTVSGPATVPNGSPQISYTAVVTDAFGNPVVGFPRQAGGTDLLNVQVSGPGQFKDGDVQTDANGAIKLNVAVASGAEGDVKIQVKGVNSAVFGNFDQFGAAKDRLTAQSTTDDGKGLTASADVATATTKVEPGTSAPTKVDPNLTVSGKGAKTDVVKANASSKAAGATATLWVNGKKVKTGKLNSAGDFTFRVKDKNGNKATKYTVKISSTKLTLADSASKRIR